MTKTYDAKTILQNLCFDVERMLREETNPKDVLDYIDLKLSFLRAKRKYEVIRWWDKK